ncbi:uncharacterized protein LOC135570758 [Oncorhynchus nerka]|uniref:uncharacterized protein LOC135570758 n=1 Tax=Oncorhynchus nerka TaxID=8023 RepID=UPI0031B801AF
MIPNYLHIVDHVQHGPLSKEQLPSRYDNIFNRPVESVPGDVYFELDESITPVQCAPRNVSIAMKVAVKAQLDKYEADGHMTSVTKPTDWISNMVIVKKTEKLRVCIDPKHLNQALKQFGVSVAPEVYQRKQHELLAGLKVIEPIADDVLIVGCGDTDEEAERIHDVKLLALMERCRSVKFRFGLKKLQFKVKDVHFHGRILSAAGPRQRQSDPRQAKPV